MATLLPGLCFPARAKSLRDLARLLLALALIGFSLQPVTIAAAGGPPSRQVAAGVASSGTPMAMAGHDCPDHGGSAPREPAPVHAHTVACLTVCCFATALDLVPAAIAHDMTALSRIPASERRPVGHLPSLDPPPPKFS